MDDSEKGLSPTSTPSSTAPTRLSSPVLQHVSFAHNLSPLRRHQHPSTIPHIGLRKRRLLSQIIFALGILSIIGWAVVGENGMRDVITIIGSKGMNFSPLSRGNVRTNDFVKKDKDSNVLTMHLYLVSY